MPLSAHARLNIFITHNIDNLDSKFQQTSQRVSLMDVPWVLQTVCHSTTLVWNVLQLR